MHNFDVDEFFSDFYGVVIDKWEPKELVKNKVSKEYRDYLRTLPLHHSQKEISTEENESVSIMKSDQYMISLRN